MTKVKAVTKKAVKEYIKMTKGQYSSRSAFQHDLAVNLSELRLNPVENAYRINLFSKALILLPELY